MYIKKTLIFKAFLSTPLNIQTRQGVDKSTLTTPSTPSTHSTHSTPLCVLYPGISGDIGGHKRGIGSERGKGRGRARDTKRTKTAIHGRGERYKKEKRLSVPLRQTFFLRNYKHIALFPPDKRNRPYARIL